MKFIRGLSSITLVSYLSVSSGAALAKVPEQVSNPTSSAQTEPMIIANPFRIIREGVQTLDQINQIRLREQRRQEQEAARREAAERRRLEAERRQRYFESLSPEQQQAYLAQQRAAQARQNEAMLSLLGWGATMLIMSGGSSSEPAPAKPSYEYYPPSCRYQYIGGESVKICE